MTHVKLLLRFRVMETQLKETVRNRKQTEAACIIVTRLLAHIVPSNILPKMFHSSNKITEFTALL